MIVGMVMVVTAEQDSRASKIIRCKSSNSNSGRMKLGITRSITTMAKSKTIPQNSSNNNHDRSRFRFILCGRVFVCFLHVCMHVNWYHLCCEFITRKKKCSYARARVGELKKSSQCPKRKPTCGSSSSPSPEPAPKPQHPWPTKPPPSQQSSPKDYSPTSQKRHQP